MSPKLPPNKRYITTHDATGKSIYAPSPSQIYNSAGTTGGLARSYSVATVPATLADEADIKAYLAGPHESVSSVGRREIVVPSEGGKYNGSNVFVIDLAPGGFSAMHQTVSIDFSICVIGTIVHELDGGETVTLKPGVSCRTCVGGSCVLDLLTDSGQDHIVQRGTNHRWINASQTEWARAVAVTLPCVPFEVGGEMLREVHARDPRGFKPKL